MALVSVIIPCYNAEKYIVKCLESMQNQTFRDFNVIVVDDYSTDDSQKIIIDYKNNCNFELLLEKNENNSGPAISRNKGVLLSDAKYIAYCDSDDWYEDNYLELMVQKANENDADMVFCAHKKVDADGKVISIQNVDINNQNISVNTALSIGADSLCSIMIKKEIVLKVPQPDLRCGEDMAVIPLMIMESKKFSVVNEPIYNYFCRAGSLSLSSTEKTVENLQFSFAYIEQNKVSGYENEIEFIGIKNLIYGALLNLFKFSNDKDKAKYILFKFEEKYPLWYKNNYIRNLQVYKRIFLWAARKRCFFLLKLLSKTHKLLTEKSK